MLLETLVVGYLDTNCYVIAPDESANGIIIDPAGDADLIMNVITSNNLAIKYIILTHGHWDHCGAVNEISKTTGAKICIHKADKAMLGDPNLSMSYVFGDEGNDMVQPDIELSDDQVLEVGDLRAEILHTPGHTAGGITVHIKDSLFTGDLLFNKAVGRTDLPSGSHEVLLDSIRTKIMTFSDNTKVYPGHGPSTTIGDERRGNPFLT